MKLFLHNGGYGCGNVGDDAILDGVLSMIEGKYEFVVSAYDYGGISQTFNVQCIGFYQEPGDYDVWAIWGGGVVYKEHMDSLLPLVEKALNKGKKLWIRAIGVGAEAGVNWNYVTRIFREAEILTVRDRRSQSIIWEHCGLKAELEIDPARLCRSAESYPVISKGAIGINLPHNADATYKAMKAVEVIGDKVNLPIVGIVALVHKFTAQDERQAFSQCEIENVIYEPDPRRLKAALHQLGLLFSARKHLSLIASQLGVPAIYLGSRKEEVASMAKEWGVSVEFLNGVKDGNSN